MIAWLFPGQPLQYGDRLTDDDDLLELDQLCRERCGFDLRNLRPLAGHELSHHTCLQLYGVAVSLWRARKLRRRGDRPDLIAEHSLGIYAALAVSGSIAEGDALALAGRIGACMAGMGRQQQFSLGSVIGIHRAELERAADQPGVYVANYNTSQHYLLAGTTAAVQHTLAACRAAGAFAVSQFDAEAPLHTPLMAGIRAELTAIVADYRFAEPQVPLVEHLAQTRLSAAHIPAFLVEELHRPVYWEQTWRHLRACGVNHGIELGSGPVLTKFNRWIESEGPA